jgi:alginate O-acetyltransferase complex protein AlgI
MLFNSLTFFIFFAVVFLLYLALPHRGQNRMLLAASYLFYGAWDWRFLFLLMFSCTMDFLFAREIGKNPAPRARKGWVSASIGLNLGILGFFKYFNFFVDSFAALLEALGLHASMPVLRIVLPVGISFYSFQSMSYTIDVYRGVLAPARRWSDFALYLAFFPQLVAGPIERATNLLPQVQQPRTVSDYGISHGAFLILWGLFQKVVIADNICRMADAAFNHPSAQALSALLGVYAFAIQIYCDFSGYSNIARGIAMMLGFRLMLNFRNPYFAANPSDFWRRWHISLSTWLRDYLYIPLGGNRHGPARTQRNLMLTMLLGGLWHGAAWTYVAWGFYHGILLVGHRWFEKIIKPMGGLNRFLAGWVGRTLGIVLFFHLICISWLLFRADTIAQAGAMLHTLLTGWATMPTEFSILSQLFTLAFYGLPLFAMEIWQYRSGDPLVALKAPRLVRALLYLALFYGIVIFGENNAQSFIYFQF